MNIIVFNIFRTSESFVYFTSIESIFVKSIRKNDLLLLMKPHIDIDGKCHMFEK